MDRLDQLRQRVLVLKCQLGDQAAWEELYRRYHPSLRYYLRGLCGSESAADDAGQEVWLTVVRCLARLKAPEALTVWLYRIARSKALSGAGPPQAFELDERTIAMPEADDDESFSPEDAARVHAAMERLRPEHRDVLLLRFMEDLSYEQIADVTGCPVGTIRSRIFYAKCALRRVLENGHD